MLGTASLVDTSLTGRSSLDVLPAASGGSGPSSWSILASSSSMQGTSSLEAEISLARCCPWQEGAAVSGGCGSCWLSGFAGTSSVLGTLSLVAAGLLASGCSVAASSGGWGSCSRSSLASTSSILGTASSVASAGNKSGAVDFTVEAAAAVDDAAWAGARAAGAKGLRDPSTAVGGDSPASEGGLWAAGAGCGDGCRLPASGRGPWSSSSSSSSSSCCC
mmetsp:Transcript_47920/g.138663  ORF Transcript_47920/g.138663 Transcript_47920/m.138663 type:complete len:219 (+) Transcript_47920:399-1055(+)